jgi:hypothetical protein
MELAPPLPLPSPPLPSPPLPSPPEHVRCESEFSFEKLLKTYLFLLAFKIFMYYKMPISIVSIIFSRLPRNYLVTLQVCR